MKFLSSLSQSLPFRKRLFLLIFLAIVLPFSFFLISNLLLETEGTTLPLLVFFSTALGIALLLRRRIVSFFQRLICRAKEGDFKYPFGEEIPDELTALTSYLDGINRAFEEKRNETRRIRERLVALNAVATAVNQTLNLDQILNEVLGTILEVTGYHGGIIFLRDEESRSLIVRAWKGLQLENIWELDKTRLGREIASEAVRRQKIIFIPNIEESQEWEIKEFKEEGIRTILVVPIIAKGKVFGSLNLVSFKLREPDLEENEFLEAVCQQMGMAIDNINLLSGWTKKAHDLSLLLETSSILSASLNRSQVLEVLSQRMMKILEADFCYTAVMDNKRKNLIFETFAWAQEKPPTIKRGKMVKVENLPFHREVLTTGKMVKIRKKDQLVPSEEKLLPLERKREVILMPLSLGTKVLGIVGVGVRSPEKLNFEKLNLCRSITSQAAIAFENAQLYQDVKQKAEEVSSLYQVTQKLSSILDQDELLDQILKVIVESFGYLNSALLLVDKKKNELFVKAARGFPDELVKNTRIKVGKEGITGWVAQTGEPLVVGDVSKDHRYIPGISECKSEIAVPLKFKGEIIGVLDAESDQLFAFGEKDVRILSQLASHIAVVLENSRLFSQEKKRCVQLALINDVSRKVVSTLDLDKLLKTAIEAIQLSFKYDHISLFLLDDSTGDLILKTCCGKSCNAVKPGFRLRKGVGVVGKAGESGRTIVCNDVDQDPTYVPAISETKSELSVPIKRGKRIMGVLDVENFTQYTFDDQDVAVLETLTDLLATAIDNTRLYEETRKKANRLELIDQINRAISSTLDLKSIFNVVSNELSKVMKFDRISLNFWHPRESLFKVELCYSPEEGIFQRNRKVIRADETSMHEVVQSGKPYYRARLIWEQDLTPMDRAIFSEGIRSYVLIPIINNQQVMAVLSLESKREDGFPLEWIELLNSMGSHLALAIQNSKLFSDLQEAYHNLKNTQAHMIQIERFRAVGEMASGVVHDFNNILASILGRVQLILMKLKKEKASLPREMVKSLRVIEKSATDGARILSRIHEFTKAKPDTAFRPTDLNQVVEDSLEMTKTYWKDKAFLSGIQIKIKKELKAKHKVLGDATELREVLTNLILNAVDAMPRGGTLTLRTEEGENSVFLTVEDTGVGMTEEIKKKIFVPFFTTKGEEGTGLGLSLAHGIITRHRGEITVKSVPGSGSSFTIKLPRCEAEEDKSMRIKPRSESARILVIEDEKNIREVLEEILSTAGHKVIQAANGEEGVELFKRQKPDLVITDLGMPGLSGWDVADKIKAEDPSTPVILSTGWRVNLDQPDVHKRSVDRVISKPFNMGQILDLISELLAQKKTQRGVTVQR